MQSAPLSSKQEALMLVLFLRGDIVEKDENFYVTMVCGSSARLEGGRIVMLGDTVKYKETNMINAFLRWQWLRRQFNQPHEEI